MFDWSEFISIYALGREFMFYVMCHLESLCLKCDLHCMQLKCYNFFSFPKLTEIRARVDLFCNLAYPPSQEGAEMLPSSRS